MKRLLLLMVVLLSTASLITAQTVISDWETVETTNEPGIFATGGTATEAGAIANPNMDAVNGSSMVYNFCEDENSLDYAGFAVVVDDIDVTGDVATICVSMMAEAETVLRLKLTQSTDGGPDVRQETTYTNIGAWEQLCYDYTMNGINGNNASGFHYQKIAFYMNYQAGVTPSEEICYQFDDLTQETNGTPPSNENVVSDWETVETTVEPGVFAAGGTATEAGAIANPNMDAVNGSSMVYNFCEDENSLDYAGFAVVLDDIDVTGDVATICVSMMAEAETVLRLKLTQSTDGGPDVRQEVTYTNTGSWEQLCYDYTMNGINGNNASGFHYEKIAFYMNYQAGVTPSEEICYQFDDLSVETSTTPSATGFLISDWETVETTNEPGVFAAGGTATEAGAIANPNMDAVNGSSMVYNFCEDENSLDYAGFAVVVDDIDVTGDVATICVSMMADIETVLRLKLTQSTDGGPDVRQEISYTNTGAWEQLCYDYTMDGINGNNASGYHYQKIAFYMNYQAGVTPSEEICYQFDDLSFDAGEPTTNVVMPENGYIADWETPTSTVDTAVSFWAGSATGASTIDNPLTDGVNGSAGVYNWCEDETSEFYAGFLVNVTDEIDCTGTEATLCISMLTDEAATLRIKLTGSQSGSEDVRHELNYDTPGAWQQLCFDLTQEGIQGQNASGEIFSTVVFYMNFVSGQQPAAPICYQFDELFVNSNGDGELLDLIGTVIQQSADHSTLTSLINTAAMWDVVNATGVTVFAPNDAAFSTLTTAELDNLMNNVDNSLINTILHLVTNDSLPSDMLAMDMTFVLRNGQDGQVTSANDAVNNANIYEADVAASNGILHYTDGLIEFLPDPAQYVHADWEVDGANPSLGWFGTASNEQNVFVEGNPNISGINTSPSVLHFKKFPDPSQSWQGATLGFERPFNFIEDMTEVCVDVFTDHDANFRMKIIESPTGANGDGLRYAGNGVGNEWSQICMDVTQPDLVHGEEGTDHIFNKIAVYMDYVNGETPADTVHFYLDNIITKNTSISNNNISDLKNFEYYPNPVTEMVTIKSDSEIEAATLVDLYGKIIFTIENPKQNSVDMSMLADGVYFIQLYGENRVSLGAVKVIKQ